MDVVGNAPWLSIEQQKIWRAYLLASALLTDRLADDLRPYEIDLQEYEVLMELSETHGQQLRMAELARRAHQSRSRMTHTVARLESRGLVERVHCTEDRRGVVARITPTGFELLERAAPRHVMAVRRFLVDAVAPEDFKALGRVMHGVLTALDAEGHDGRN